MSDTPQTDPQHFTQAVAELGEKQPVIVSTAIFNDKGVKIVEKVTAVKRGLYERLMQHKLSTPIENSVSSTPTVTTETLRPSDQWIPWYFVLFFAVFIILDSIFVYIAITSQTGVVTDKAYEKGLAYDSLLEESRLQKELGVQHEVSYDAPLLKLSLKDRDGHPIEAAKVTAKMIRPVQAGYCFLRMENSLSQCLP